MENLDFENLQEADIRGMEFSTVVDADKFYRAYARRKGFTVRIEGRRRSTTGDVTTLLLVCSKEGTRRKKHLDREDNKRPKRGITRTGCGACFRVGIRDGKWVVRHVVIDHNHALGVPDEMSFQRGEIPEHFKQQIRSMDSCGIKVCDMFQYFASMAGGMQNLGFKDKDVYNFIATEKREVVRDGDVEAAIAFLEAQTDNDRGFVYKTYVTDGRLSRLFWMDSDCVVDYACFGDVIAVDSTYRTNAYNMPMVVIGGVNNHHRSVIFATCLLDAETTDAYTWLFETFLAANSDKHPQSIVTDGDKAMMAAMAIVLPHTRHRLCSWHLRRNAEANVHDKEFLTDFRSCMFSDVTVTEFETMRHSMVARYNLQGREWIAMTYNKRQCWKLQRTSEGISGQKCVVHRGANPYTMR